MKLHEVPRRSRIRIVGDIKVPPGAPQLHEGQELNFRNVDGMYSYCTTDDGEVVHLAAWAEVELIESDFEDHNGEVPSQERWPY